MAETGCAHCWHRVGRLDVREMLAAYRCCRCDAETYPVPVPGYRNTWGTPPSATFRRTDGGTG